jgi:hypothetical protein
VRPTDRAILALWRLAALLRHPDLHWRYLRRMGRVPDVAVPRRFSERVMWRKLFDRNPLYAIFADKLACKAWLAEHAPDLPTARVLWRGTDPAAIPDELLRPGVVIKANHGSNFNLICRDRAPERDEVIRMARRWLAKPFGRTRGEWAYGQVRREVFVEELLGWPDTPVVDIKVQSGGGRIALCMVLRDVQTPRQSIAFMDEHGAPLTDDSPGFAAAPPAPPPSAMARAIEIARRLGEPFDFLRFDFLAVGDTLHGGEITLYPLAGYWDPSPGSAEVIDRMWDLRRSWFLREGAARGGPLTRAYSAALRRALGA